MRSAGDPKRGSSAATGGGTDAELTRLVLVHFGAELEAALRDAYEEVIGVPLPPLFTIELQGTPSSRSPLRKARGRASRRVARRGSRIENRLRQANPRRASTARSRGRRVRPGRAGP